LITIGIFLVFGSIEKVSSEEQPKSLTLKSLTIVDDKGTERVVISGSIPEPIILGKRMNTGRKAGGILLYDEEGNERSGYITADGYPNVLFTLDSLSRQQTLFMTEPQGSTAFWVWGDNQNEFKVTIGSETPKVEVIKNGKPTLVSPEPEKSNNLNER
jgi:hypothetical protein